MTSPNRRPLIEATGLTKFYHAGSRLSAAAGKGSVVRAIDRVSLSIAEGETVGLLGESGCGKSTLGRLLIRLETPTAGKISFDGRDITRLKGRALRRTRSAMQIVFQDPSTSLNPRYTVRSTLEEALEAHRTDRTLREKNAHLAALLSMVGLPIEALGRLPREFSVGERQRVSLARALAVEPRFLVADEPISALDPASRAQVSKLLENMRNHLGIAILLISHDVELVGRLSRRVAVMYLGRIVEVAPTLALFENARHPYTRALLSSVLGTEPGSFDKPALQGEAPSPLSPPKGCHFHPRCPHAEMICRLIVPTVRDAEPDHSVMCHFDFEGGEKRPPRADG